MRIFLYIIICFLMFSCSSEDDKKFLNALKFAGENAKQLKAIVGSYEYDSLKLKIAYFLINNMSSHESKYGFELFIPAFDSASVKYNGEKRFSTKEIFDSKIDSIIKFNPDFRSKINFVKDIETVKADFIIENIDLSIEARSRIRQFHNYNDEMFLNYVLPHKCANEPIEEGLRKNFYQEFNWVYDSAFLKYIEVLINCRIKLPF